MKVTEINKIAFHVQVHACVNKMHLIAATMIRYSSLMRKTNLSDWSNQRDVIYLSHIGQIQM